MTSRIVRLCGRQRRAVSLKITTLKLEGDKKNVPVFGPGYVDCLYTCSRLSGRVPAPTIIHIVS